MMTIYPSQSKKVSFWDVFYLVTVLALEGSFKNIDLKGEYDLEGLFKEIEKKKLSRGLVLIILMGVTCEI